ncbi:hypothetical protein SAMD00019534_077890, partial [Acytostelium subglobosum LB1]|uniref:hypothetical protein n=1 Tax=Acytostelium subglobosum LB1 TaxID=1410327 RepID=UPI000644F3BF
QRDMSGGDKFSSILKLTELDDFITPSQECIKPVEILRTKVCKGTNVHIESDGTYMEVGDDGQKSKMEKATITLNDCLACSGCITSAESVLITAQSTAEFMSVLAKNAESRQYTVVVSLSPQSRASIAAHFGVSSKTAQARLESFFQQTLKVDYVFDTGFSREFSLLESCAEFVARFKKTIDAPLPMLCSACPGWICYAEKTHGEYILPYISTTKSPQQIMGTLVKYYLGDKLLNNQSNRPSEIYHVTIMPCYDKKLEASRSDFYSDLFKSKDVDCVLSTSEVLELLKEKNVDFNSIDETMADTGSAQEAQQAQLNRCLFKNIDESSGDLFGVEGSSGGYFEFLYRYAARELFGITVDKIEYQTGRNTDFMEASIEVSGKKVLCFSKAYGFRNIQNIVRKIKTGKIPYHFIEVMACPSGCINGGGQIKAGSGTIKEQKVLIQQSEDRYNEQSVKLPLEDKRVTEIYDLWLNGVFSADAKSKL